MGQSTLDFTNFTEADPDSQFTFNTNTVNWSYTANSNYAARALYFDGYSLFPSAEFPTNPFLGDFEIDFSFRFTQVDLGTQWGIFGLSSYIYSDGPTSDDINFGLNISNGVSTGASGIFCAVGPDPTIGGILNGEFAGDLSAYINTIIYFTLSFKRFNEDGNAEVTISTYTDSDRTIVLFPPATVGIVGLIDEEIANWRYIYTVSTPNTFTTTDSVNSGNSYPITLRYTPPVPKNRGQVITLL